MGCTGMGLQCTGMMYWLDWDELGYTALDQDRTRMGHG